jgi:phage terminase small subunit
VGEVRDRAAIVAGLVERGASRDRASLYADAYLEYMEASDNIRAQGAMVLHPRTANPIENPYLQIRDRAARTLRAMRGLPSSWLW